MKKKHWQVSIFDKTSETIRNDTLYTTDTEVYLTFELIDEDFTPDSAMVTIYNIYGTATINASADIVDGIVNYEMPVDAIGHQGGWRTQVVFTKDNEDYTTTVIEFDVDGHLLDNKKPTIVYIENWNSFIKHGDRLVDDWEKLEKIRQANERKRELAESVRQNTFEINESTRQVNEQGRESAEIERVSNEEERELNEVERISKDGERDSKIEVVEEDLEQHKLDYVEEISKKANKVQEDWITPTLLNGWVNIDDGTVSQTCQYMKDTLGFVHIKGVVKNGTAIDVFILPDGYRPLANSYFSCAKTGLNEAYQLRIDRNGNLRIPHAQGSPWYSIHAIFKAKEV